MPLSRVLLLSLLLPAALLGGALGFQYLGGLAPCDLCIDQRWPHGIAIALAVLGLVLMTTSKGWAKIPALLAPLAIMASGVIAVYHSGVERKWWPGPPCASAVDPSLPMEEYLKAIANATVVNCNDIAWSLFGLSMANYNALISLLGGGALVVLTFKALRAAR